MNGRRLLLAIAAAFALIAVIAGFIWQRDRSGVASPQTFDVRGVVRSVDLTDGTLRVQHEEIPDYMPAMTMSLPVKPSELLRGLGTNDVIKFRLEVTEDDSWISRIEKVTGGAPAPAASDTIGSNDWRLARINAGEKVPDFTIVDQNGRARSLSEFRGKAVLVNFIYTRCPLPNFCPLLSRKFAEMQQTLATNMPGKFHLISITIDPEHDTADVLRGYAKLWSKDERTWTFGTGSRDDINTIAARFGLIHERAATGQIDHDLRTALIDPQGRLVHVWKSNFWKREEILQRLREL